MPDHGEAVMGSRTSTFCIRAPLVPLAVATAHGLKPELVERLRDNGTLRWVFDISPVHKVKSEFRYWMPGLAAYAGIGGPMLNDLSEEEVVDHVIGVKTRSRFSKAEVCFRLQCSETTVKRLMENDLLKGETDAGQYWILVHSLKTFLLSRIYA